MKTVLVSLEWRSPENSRVTPHFNASIGSRHNRGFFTLGAFTDTVVLGRTKDSKLDTGDGVIFLCPYPSIRHGIV